MYSFVDNELVYRPDSRGYKKRVMAVDYRMSIETRFLKRVVRVVGVATRLSDLRNDGDAEMEEPVTNLLLPFDRVSS